MSIPRCISTQHPDNVTLPFFAKNSVLSGDDEVQEAYYHFSHLGIQEQMWDAEGKEVDNFVVKKLLSKYENFFRKKKLGKDLFLTLRVPNPAEEQNEAKILVESLQSIPRSFDTARQFYQEDVAPIFEVILPMTTSANQLQCVYDYYTKYVVGLQKEKVGNTTIQEWIGDSKPAAINVIPLVEDKESMSNIKNIVATYIKDKKIEYQRVFLARSDPALNYGWLSAILLNKWACAQLDELQEEQSLPIYPIIGVGTAPFRGNFRPDNSSCLKGYPSVQTFSIQSAFKYDFAPETVKDAIADINDTQRGKAHHVDREKTFELLERYSAQYMKDLQLTIPFIHRISKYIPRRRKRKLHIGLFGYSRGVGGVKLPRAISFCASLYSLGIPPELLGLQALTEKDETFLQDGMYKNFFDDINTALQYVNISNVAKIAPKLKVFTVEALDKYCVRIDMEHKEVTTNILDVISAETYTELPDLVVKAGWVRHFLG